MEELLDQQLLLLQRLSDLTNRVADEAYRQNCEYSIDADLEAQELKFALDKVEQRLGAVRAKQRRRQK